MRVAVVGGGIAGLAAAWELRSSATEVTVVEPGILGGCVRTAQLEGIAVDEGPDAFLTRTPAALQLCEELGIAGELVAPAPGRTLVWSGRRLRALPDGLVLGVPGRLGPVLRSGLLSPAGVARAGLDLVTPRTPVGEDVGVGELVTARFGREVATRLVEPLLGSIHASRIEGLSAAATAPQLLAAARRKRSLLRALRRRPGPGDGPAGGGPLFLAPATGLGRVVERLVAELTARGVGFEPVAATGLTCRGSAVEVAGVGSFDAAVLAVPAATAAGLLGPAAPPGLAGITTTSVDLVTLVWDAARAALPDGVNGFLVPPGEGRLVTACSFGSHKWPRWSLPGRVVLRVSVGRHGDRRAAELPDEALVDRVAAELRQALGARGEPCAARVSRWREVFPRYSVGHLGLVAGIRAELHRRAPAVALAGSGYDGVGVPACIASGRAAAAELLPSS